MNAGISVSRVGGAAQRPAMKAVSGTVRLELAQYRELEAFAQFGSDLDKASQQQIARGQRVVEILKQPQYQPLPVELQVASIFAVTNAKLDDIPVIDVRRFEADLHEFLKARNAPLLAKLATDKLNDDMRTELSAAIDEFRASFVASEQAAVSDDDVSWDAMATAESMDAEDADAAEPVQA
jgi:F-type H+-transporting ATPase subunit alpha